MRQYAGIWFPDDGVTLTKSLKARLDVEALYHGDRFEEAMVHCPGRRLAVDCGANVGMWTRELAKRFDRVVAIEPSAANFECLEANTGHLANVTRLRYALGERHGAVGLEGNKGEFSARVVEGDEVAMAPLDSFNILEVDYLKLHVNGYELAALKGAAGTLAVHRPVLTVVLKPKLAHYGSSNEEVIGWLEARGYRLAGGKKPYRIFTPA